MMSSMTLTESIGEFTDAVKNMTFMQYMKFYVCFFFILNGSLMVAFLDSPHYCGNILDPTKVDEQGIGIFATYLKWCNILIIVGAVCSIVYMIYQMCSDEFDGPGYDELNEPDYSLYQTMRHHKHAAYDGDDNDRFETASHYSKSNESIISSSTLHRRSNKYNSSSDSAFALSDANVNNIGAMANDSMENGRHVSHNEFRLDTYSNYQQSSQQTSPFQHSRRPRNPRNPHSNINLPSSQQPRNSSGSGSGNDDGSFQNQYHEGSFQNQYRPEPRHQEPAFRHRRQYPDSSQGMHR